MLATVLSHVPRSIRISAVVRRRAFAIVAALLAFALGLAPTAAAVPAPENPKALLEVTKEVTTPESKVVHSGGDITWTITVNCQSDTVYCWDATLTDAIPEPFEYVPDSLQFTSDGDWPDPTITEPASDNDNTLTVVFNDENNSFPGQTGLASGHGMTFTLSAHLPANAVIPAGGQDIPNTAHLTSTDAQVKDDEATDTARIEFVASLEPQVSKSWSENRMVAGDNSTVTINLDAWHNSNVPAGSLVVTDPADGSDSFDHFAFEDFTSLTLPAGADQAVISLDLAGGGSVDFPASATLPNAAAVTAALDAVGAARADIIGVTTEFSHSSGDDVIPAGEHALLSFDMTQREGLSSETVGNIASATVTSDFGDETATAQDSIVVEPRSLSARATKVYTDATGNTLSNNQNIVTGETFGGRATVTSSGNVRLTSLTVNDPALHDPTGTPVAEHTFSAQGVAFEGFGTDGTNSIGAANSVPSGATAATVTYTYVGGGTETLAATLNSPGVTFPAPSGTVDGFSITYTGDLAPNASARLPYQLTAGDVPVDGARNSADGMVTTADDSADAAPATDVVEIEVPYVESTTTKAIAPSRVSLEPGATFVSILTSRLDKTDGTPLSNVPVDSLVIEDSIDHQAGTGTSVWDSTFRPTGVAATTLPAGVQATIETYDGIDWSVFTVATDAIAEQSFGVAGGVDGVRVTYTKTDGTPLDESQRYRTLLNWEANGVNTLDTFTNLALSQATGINPADPATPVIGDEVTDVDTLTTRTGLPGDEPGESPIDVVAAKTWRDSAATGSRALNVPLWIPATGDYPQFGLSIGVENNSDYGIPVESLTLREPALGAQEIEGSTAAETDPFDAIQVLSLESVNTPEGADLDTFTVTLTPQGAPSETFGPAHPDTVTAQVNTYLAANDDVTSIEISVHSEAGGIESGERLNALFATQVRETTLAGVAVDPNDLAASALTVDNVVQGAGEYSHYSADAAAQDSLELRALATQEVTVQALKSLSPSSATILSADTDPTVTMTLGANKFAADATAPDRDSYSNPVRYEITDVTPEFWNLFTLQSPTTIVGEPTGASTDVKFSIEYLVGTDWVAPDGAPLDGFDVPQGASFRALPAAATLPPAGHTFADVTGVRVNFWTDGSARLPDMSTHATNLSAYGQKIRFDFELRSSFRDSGDAVPDGTSVVNAVTVDAVNAQDNSAQDTADANFSVAMRTSDVSISKTPRDTLTAAGSSINFGLSLTNDGTTAVRGLVLTDTIQCVAGVPDMIYDAETATITLGSGGTNADDVSTDLADASVTYETGCVDGTDTITIALPEANTVWPGETYAVTLPLTVSAGHAPGTFINTYDLAYTDELGAHTVDPVEVDISVMDAPGYWFTKYVREVVDTDAGEQLTGIDGMCRGTEEEYLNGDLDPWQRTPCTVKTEPGGTSEWRLWLTNAGNQPTKQLVAVDVLPTPGDVGITTALSGLSRGSTFTPELVAGMEVEWLGAEGTLEVQYQTAVNEGCVMTGGVDEQDPFSARCADWESDWDAIKDDADALAQVTALRFEITYADDDLLQPGEAVRIYFRTQNPEVLPANAPADDAPAWNSFGGWAQTLAHQGGNGGQAAYTYFRTAPLKAGIVMSQPETPLSIGDRVWIDDNRNGVQDDGELPLPGVTVRLHDLTGAVLAETVTDAEGYYVFEGLYPATYRVSFELTDEQQAIYMATLPLAGGSDVDSNISSTADDGGAYWTSPVHIDYPSRGASDDVMSSDEYNALGFQQIADGSAINPTIDAGFMLIDPRWISVTGASECVFDAPWFSFEITTSAYVEQGLPYTISWYADADGDLIPDGSGAPVHVDEFPAGSPLSGAVLWPGAAVDPVTQWGTAWPGWRVATRDEVPTWENLILDRSADVATLRDGALIVVTMNPDSSVWSAYPMSTPSCAVDRVPDLAVSKTADTDAVAAGNEVSWDLSVTNDGPGATDDVVLTDDIPSTLRVTDVTAADPADHTQPAWNSCTVDGTDADGYGGTVTCVLSGWIGAGQSAPNVTITTAVSSDATGTVTNEATVAWTDPDQDEPTSEEASDEDDVTVSAANSLAVTGVDAWRMMAVAVALLMAGAVLVIVRRRSA
ncbi:SdrD B-like domain-containing protein [Demequina sediminicola]|uniref:SdrD B-like domain-containing protein n=1 Tax=Demequina sediminicola TaxID=1095026 RepID=UPI0007813E34|nr:SdrD B-like domain-containing protein [Demequina sediminicola]